MAAAAPAICLARVAVLQLERGRRKLQQEVASGVRAPFCGGRERGGRPHDARRGRGVAVVALTRERRARLGRRKRRHAGPDRQ
jgi:hypothetical protein